MWFGCGFHCECGERRKPLLSRKWVVISRAGRHRLPNYWSREVSIVHCQVCGATGRSKGRYIDLLGDEPDIGSWLP